MNDQDAEEVHRANLRRYANLARTYPNGRHIYDMEYLAYKMLSEWVLISAAGIDDACVANIGCGECLEELWFLPRVRKWDAYDCTPEVIEASKRRISKTFAGGVAGRYRAYVVDCRHLVGKGDYDVVLCLSVLEHFVLEEDISSTLRNILAMLRPGGKAVISISNAKNFLYTEYASKQIACGNYAWERPLCPDAFRQKLNSAGLQVIRISSEMQLCNGTRDIYLQQINEAIVSLGSRMGFLVEKRDKAYK